MNKPFYLNPFLHILGAIAAGVALGWLNPALAEKMKPLGDAFIYAIRIMVGPVIFLTVTTGIAAMRNVRLLGQVGLKAILYFEGLSTLALITGLLGAWLLQPGAGFPFEVARPIAQATQNIAASQAETTALINTLAATIRKNWILQILLLAVFSGLALTLAGRRATRVIVFGEQLTGWLFRVVGWVLMAAPLATFGAMSYTVGHYGLVSVGPLLSLLGVHYLTTVLFVVFVLGAIAHYCGFSIFRFIAYIKEELMIVFATSSSLAAMPRLIEKLRNAGCQDPVVGVVVPAGYSFNLNGSNIFLTISVVFLAQAQGIVLGFPQYLSIFAVAMITSKGASGIAGSAFIALAATIAAVPAIPDSSLVLIVGIERLLKSRSMSNLIGNGVACLAVAAWSDHLDRSRLQACRLTATS